ncbi:MAG: FMN-binding protein, partial [Halopseudomonas sp.]
TPGLGDKVQLNKSTWVLDFNGTSLSMPAPENWGVRKDGGDFDQFTGATITPRAVVQAVYRALQYFEAQRDQLLELTTEELARG